MRKGEKRKGKKGQITLFVILAIIIVAAILVFFFYVQPRFFPSTKGELTYASCIEDSINRNVNALGASAGFNKNFFSYRYSGQNIPYLCYTSLFYAPCVMQKPFLKQHFEQNLLEKSAPEIENCIDTAIENMKAKGYTLSSPLTKKEISISIKPEQIVVNIGPPIVMEKGGSESYNFKPVIVSSPLYEMLMISTSILQFEGKFGDSDVNLMMDLYPSYIIQKIRDSDENKVYILQDKISGIKFQFASRSYAWPSGYGMSV
jgi:hypothetical protein